MKRLAIGLFGLGNVGSALAAQAAAQPELGVYIVKACVRNIDKPRSALFPVTGDPDEIFNDPAVDIIVELTDDPEAGWRIVSRALSLGKPVVSASKRLVARRFHELLARSRRAGVPFLYEASVCAALPVIRILEDYYNSGTVSGLSGIINGSTNYILTSMTESGCGFDAALRQAQEKGYAESDPFLDISGLDAVNKLAILIIHAFGRVLPPDDIPCFGIENIRPEDIEVAKNLGRTIKLTAGAEYKDGLLTAQVIPSFVPEDNALAQIRYEENALAITAGGGGIQLMRGAGAGGDPTASAVLADISAIAYGYRYCYKLLEKRSQIKYSRDTVLPVYLSSTDRSRLSEITLSNSTKLVKKGGIVYKTGEISIDALRSLALKSSDIFCALVNNKKLSAEYNLNKGGSNAVNQ